MGLMDLIGERGLDILKSSGGDPKKIAAITKLMGASKPSEAQSKSIESAKDTMGKMWTLGSYFADMSKGGSDLEQQAVDTLGRGKISGLISRGAYHTGKWAPKITGESPGSEDYKSLKPTVAVALARMDTGARPAKEVIKYYFNTLPNYGDTWQTFAGKISGSMYSAFSRKFAAEGKEFANNPDLRTQAKKQVEDLLRTFMPPEELKKYKKRKTNF